MSISEAERSAASAGGGPLGGRFKTGSKATLPPPQPQHRVRIYTVQLCLHYITIVRFQAPPGRAISISSSGGGGGGGFMCRSPSSSLIPGGPAPPHLQSSASGGSASATTSGLALAASSAVGAASAATHSTGVPHPPRFDEDVQLPLIKVAVLGARGVGKTALVQVRRQEEMAL